ncbi:MAG: hypothetical protein INR63_12710 [Actinomycetospora chiangmaiensis]|nr:hypothetical protein [Actinomycetospora chiangmaiensis]
MTRPKRAFPDDTPPTLAPDLAERRPKLVLPMGRGSRGKTMLCRWMIERALNAGRVPVVADGDRTNQSLARSFSGVLSPPSADDADVRAWIAGLVEALLTERQDTVLDLGGGDLVLKGLAREMDLLPWLTGLGVDLVAVHLIGAASDDMAFLQSVEEGSLLAAPATILVLNEGMVPPGRSPHAAFSATVQAHPILTATVARGARVVSMPRLEPASEVEERGMTFVAASENQAPGGQPPLGPWRAQQVAIWRRRMAEAFASVEEWLP